MKKKREDLTKTVSNNIYNCNTRQYIRMHFISAVQMSRVQGCVVKCNTVQYDTDVLLPLPPFKLSHVTSVKIKFGKVINDFSSRDLLLRPYKNKA